jgi:hypothetical protein
MAFPIKARQRLRLRGRYVAAVLIATAASVMSVDKVGFAPPSLHARDWQIGAASTTLLIDTPQSEILNLGATTDDFGSLQARAALLGNLMATDPVKAEIARLMGLPASHIQASAPITANVPQTLVEPGSGASATNILASADHYKVQIQADPEVPILHIYTQAPSGPAAVDLANDSVAGLRDYLSSLSAQQGLYAASHVRLEQLGVATGGVINSRVSEEIAMLVFVTAFAAVCFASVGLSRLRLGWGIAGHEMPAAR